MPRNGSGVYSLPTGTDDFVPNTPIESARMDSLTADLASDLNTARPIVAGGTGAVTAVAAADNLSTVSSTLASATTTDLGTATGIHVEISGNTTITGFGSVAAGAIRVLKFTSTPTLTHNATSLINITGANITAQANDVAVMRSSGSGNWRMLGYARADGTVLRGYTYRRDVIFNTPGSSTYTPDAQVRAVKVRVWGAGGGGRSIDNGGAIRSGPGGGGGGYAEKFITAVAASATITIGAGGTSTNSGGNSSFADGTETLTGGGGGSGAQVTGSGPQTAGSGGTASGGDFNVSGGVGEATVGNLLNRSGSGGFTPYALGMPGNGRLEATTSGVLAATGYGAGGAGANSGGSVGTKSAGAGAQGLVIIEEYS